MLIVSGTSTDQTAKSDMSLAAALPEAVTMQMDYIGLLADWKEFELQTDKMALEVCLR